MSSPLVYHYFVGFVNFVSDFFICSLKEGDAYGLRWSNGVGTLPGSSLKVPFLLHFIDLILSLNFLIFKPCALVPSKWVRHAGSYPRCRRQSRICTDTALSECSLPHLRCKCPDSRSNPSTNADTGLARLPHEHSSIPFCSIFKIYIILSNLISTFVEIKLTM